MKWNKNCFSIYTFFLYFKKFSSKLLKASKTGSKTCQLSSVFWLISLDGYKCFLLTLVFTPTPYLISLLFLNIFSSSLFYWDYIWLWNVPPKSWGSDFQVFLSISVKGHRQKKKMDYLDWVISSCFAELGSVLGPFCLLCSHTFYPLLLFCPLSTFLLAIFLPFALYRHYFPSKCHK